MLLLITGSLLFSSCIAKNIRGIGCSLSAPLGNDDYVGVTACGTNTYIDHHRLKPSSTVTGKRVLCLEDCRNAALSNNLEIQAAYMEQLSQRLLVDATLAKALPRLVLSGDLKERDNPPYSFSDVLGQEGRHPQPGTGGTGVTNYSTGHERSTWRYFLETRWSPTDAALALYLSRNNRNDARKAHFQRVRVAQKIVGRVDAAFFRVLSLQEAMNSATRLAEIRSKVVRNMENLKASGLASSDDYYRAVEQEAEARLSLSRFRSEMEAQRSILAHAMGLSPDYCVDGGFVLQGTLTRPGAIAALCTLELEAIKNRPEAYVAGLEHINSQNDLKRSIVKCFPKVTGFWRFTRDKDRYLYNKDWKEVGLAVYFDLIDLLSSYRESRALKAARAKTHREIGNVALGITTEVRLAALKYHRSVEDLEVMDRLVQSAQQRLDVARGRASLSDLDRIAVMTTEGDVLKRRIDRMEGLGETNAHLTELQAAMGTNYREALPQ